MEEIRNASVYVGTYKKYNKGSLFGKWLNLADYESKEDFYRACRELHKDESDPEFMFQDWEYLPSGLIGESWISEKIWNLLDLDDNDLEIVYHYLQCTSTDITDCDIDEVISDAKESYVGYFESVRDLGECEAEEFVFINVPKEMRSILERYFDFEAYGSASADDYYEDDGYYYDLSRI